MDNGDIARSLDELADLLELAEANPFRVRAYRGAARTVEELATPVVALVASGVDLTTLPGIGKDLARHLRELVAIGHLGELERLATEVPRSLLELTRLSGVGPKKARRLWLELGVDSIAALEAAARAGRVARLSGFGPVSQQRLLAAIARREQVGSRVGLAAAEVELAALVDHLRTAAGVERVEATGGFRRRQETVGELDLLVVAGDASAAVARFLAYPRVSRVTAAEVDRTVIVLGSGLQVGLRVVPRESHGAALVRWTGSAGHHVKLRRRATERGLRLSEHGVFRAGDGEADGGEPSAGERVAGAHEEEVYAALGLPWIPPELREDRGEVEAAARGGLPRLVERGDLRGDLQMHSTWSDGKDTIEAMLAAAAARGYEYVALTDHSKTLAMAGGLDETRLRLQWREIDAVAPRHPEIRLLRSLEVDILADGTLDLADELLAGLDLVVVAVHTRFDLPPAEQTRRVLRALAHPRVDLLAHPTGRILGRRAPIAVDLEAVLLAARQRGIAVELNSQPHRLDLADTQLLRARELGVPVAISSDAHRVTELDLVRYGVEQARRAWLAPEQVVNCWPLDRLRAWRGRRSR